MSNSNRRNSTRNIVLVQAAAASTGGGRAQQQQQQQQQQQISDTLGTAGHLQQQQQQHQQLTQTQTQHQNAVITVVNTSEGAAAASTSTGSAADGGGCGGGAVGGGGSNSCSVSGSDKLSSSVATMRFTQEEKDLMFTLFQQHENIIDIKFRKKQRSKCSVREAWLEIVEEFNNNPVTNAPRTIKQLQKFWLNSRLRKQYPYRCYEEQSPASNVDISNELQHLNDSVIKNEPDPSLYNADSQQGDGRIIVAPQVQESHDDEDEGVSISGTDEQQQPQLQQQQEQVNYASMDIDSNTEIDDEENAQQVSYGHAYIRGGKQSPDVSDLLHFKSTTRSESNAANKIVTTGPTQISFSDLKTHQINVTHYQQQHQQQQQQQHSTVLTAVQQHYAPQQQQHQQQHHSQQQHQQQQHQTQTTTHLISVAAPNECHHHQQAQPHHQQQMKLQLAHGATAQYATAAHTYALSTLPMALASLPQQTVATSAESAMANVPNEISIGAANATNTPIVITTSNGTTTATPLDNFQSVQEKINYYQIKEAAERAREAEERAREAEARSKEASYCAEIKRLELARLKTEMNFMRELHPLQIDELKMRIRKCKMENAELCADLAAPAAAADVVGRKRSKRSVIKSPHESN